MSDLSDSLTVTHLSWAIWANCSQSLIWFEQNEQRSEREWANSQPWGQIGHGVGHFLRKDYSCDITLVYLTIFLWHMGTELASQEWLVVPPFILIQVGLVVPPIILIQVWLVVPPFILILCRTSGATFHSHPGRTSGCHLSFSSLWARATFHCHSGRTM